MPQPASVRVASAQFQFRGISSAEEFERQVEYWVGAAAGYGADFVVFPEFFTMELLTIGGKTLPPAEAMAEIARYTERFRTFMQELATRQRINIVGGSHIVRTAAGDLRNTCHVFLRDGAVHAREKLHVTPFERELWGVAGGDAAEVIPTDCGPVGVMICYDSEFPELARHLVDQGAQILFVPFCTEDRRGFLRVHYCCQARAVENQCYVVTSGVVGNLPHVQDMDVHYGASAILTPSDFPFARDGIAAEAPINAETLIVADLPLDAMIAAREAGAVQNLKDRRGDLYRVEWKQA